MPRKARPWYRAGRGSWFVQIEGVKHDLEVSDPENEAAAIAAFKKLLVKLGIQAPDEPKSKGPTVAEAVTSFLKSRSHLAASTLGGYRWYLGVLVARFGTLSVPDLDTGEVSSYAYSRSTWGDDTRRNFLCTVETLLDHAGRVVKFDKPARGSAGIESLIAEEVYWQAIGAARGDLKPLLIVLWNTGARPSEITRLTVDRIDWQHLSITWKTHKTAKRTGRVRVIHLPPDAAAALDGQRKKYGEGLLFRTRLGTQWQAKPLAQAVWRLSKRIGHRLTAYGCRHSFATNGLELGLPDTHVAALLGQTSTKMLHHHYSHLTANARLLKEAAEKIRPKSA